MANLGRELASVLQPILGSPLTPDKGGSDLYRLFANGEDGFLFGNFGDLTRLFQTSVGGTQVAADADPVGLALEDSKWAKRTAAQQVAQATELITNGGFDADTNWTKTQATISGGAGTVNSPDGTFAGLQQNISLVANGLYRIQFDVTAVVSGTWAVAGSQFASGVDLLSGTTTGTKVVYAIAAATGLGDIQLKRRAGAAAQFSVDNVSVKLVAGNHGLQATTTKRPFYKPNGGKPFLSLDGSDDCLVTPFIPTAALTLAVACRFPATDATARIMIGGGASTGNKRAFIGKNSTDGKVAIGWGSETVGIGWGSDLGTIDHVIVLTGDGSTRDIWVDGALIDSRAPSGGPDGTGGGVSLGAYNNAGATGVVSAGNLYAAMGLSRRASAGEIDLITSKFRSTYQ